MSPESYKIRWDLILKKEIEYLQKKYPDIDVKSNYQGIISDLMENKIKSKIMVNKNDLIAYGYIMDSVEKHDRIYADIGFLNQKYINNERLKVFFDWILEAGKNSRKKIMLNPIFNENEISEKYLESIGFKKAVRKRMVLNLDDYTYNEISTKYETGNPRDISSEIYADAEYDAFRYSSDAFLFSSIRQDRIESVNSLFNGEYGKILYDASLIIKNKGRVIGSVLSSQISFDRAFILSIFVKKEHRNEGNGKYLLYSALNRLKALSYKYVYLWVNEKNTAYKMYGDAGFKFDNYPPEIIYYINKP